MNIAVSESDATREIHDKIRSFVAEEFDSKVTRIERQRRWRPMWRVDIEKDGVESGLLFKADRAWAAHPYPLKREWDVLQVLENNGIPVTPLHAPAKAGVRSTRTSI